MNFPHASSRRGVDREHTAVTPSGRLKPGRWLQGSPHRCVHKLGVGAAPSLPPSRVAEVRSCRTRRATGTPSVRDQHAHPRHACATWYPQVPSASCNRPRRRHQRWLIHRFMLAASRCTGRTPRTGRSREQGPFTVTLRWFGAWASSPSTCPGAHRGASHVSSAAGTHLARARSAPTSTRASRDSAPRQPPPFSPPYCSSLTLLDHWASDCSPHKLPCLPSPRSSVFSGRCGPRSMPVSSGRGSEQRPNWRMLGRADSPSSSASCSLLWH